MKTLLASSIGLALLGASLVSAAPCDPQAIAQGHAAEPTTADLRRAFARQGVRLNAAEAASIRANVLLAIQEARAHGIGKSKVDFALVEIAQDLGLEAGPGSNTLRTLRGAVRELLAAPPVPSAPPRQSPGLQ